MLCYLNSNETAHDVVTIEKYMLSYEQLKDKAREFLAATGLTVEEFQKLLPAFEVAYEKRYPRRKTLEGKPRQWRAGAGAKGVLCSGEERLLFILVYQKTHPLQTMHGLQFGLSQSQTNYWIHQLLPALKHALADLGHQPEREGSRVAATLPMALEGVPDLAIDGTGAGNARTKTKRKRRTTAARRRRIPTRTLCW